jgi:hypothetical protein
LYNNAQTTIYYKYDAGGKRALRYIVLDATKSAKVDSTKNNQSANEQKFEETIEDSKITIYPNPTQGELKIDISGFDFTNGSSVNIYNAKGALMDTKTKLINSNQMDLSGYAPGIYLLKIKLGDKVSEWKVFKK